MIPIEQLRVVRPEDTTPGKLLLTSPLAPKSPRFSLIHGGELMTINLAADGFRVQAFPQRGAPWAQAADFKLSVDPASIVNIKKEEVPVGSVGLVEGVAGFYVDYDREKALVTLQGNVVLEIEIPQMTFFRRWSIAVPGAGKNDITIYSSDLPAEPMT